MLIASVIDVVKLKGLIEAIIIIILKKNGNLN
jgi:hypothetical protein